MTHRVVLATIGLVVALTGLVAFGAWSSPGSTATPAFDGRALFIAKGCSSCHTGPDSTAAIGTGPALVDAASWADDRRPGTDAPTYLAESMRDPGAFVSPAREGSNEMPVLALTTDEIDRLVDYLLER